MTQEMKKTSIQQRKKIELSDFLTNPIDHIRQLRPTEIKILDHIAWLQAKYKSVFTSQGRIGEVIDCTRSYVNTRIKKLCELGYLTKTWHPWTTCTYKVSNILSNNSSIAVLSEILPNLKYLFVFTPLCLSLLNSPCQEYGSPATSDTSTRSISLTLFSWTIRNKDNDTTSNIQLRARGERRRGWREGFWRRERIEGIPIKKGDGVELMESYYGRKRLTYAGWVALSPYPDSVQRRAFRQLRLKGEGVVKPMAYLIAVCKGMCEKEGIKADYAKKMRFVKELGMRGGEEEWCALSEQELLEVEKSGRGEERPKRGEWGGHVEERDRVKIIETREEIERAIEELSKNDWFARLTGRSAEEFFKERGEGHEFERSSASRYEEIQRKRREEREESKKRREERLAEEEGIRRDIRDGNLRGELFRNKMREAKAQMGARGNSFKNEPGSTENEENGIDNEFIRDPIGNGPKMQRGMLLKEGNLSGLLAFGRPGSITKTKNSGPV